MSATELTRLTAAGAVAAIQRGETDAAELFGAYRAAAQADELNAYLWVAQDAPVAPPPSAPLAGVPLAVKDLFCTEGVPSQAGSKIIEGYRPPYTATAVAKLAGAGAPLLGKTNQDEFAMGSSNENSAFGPVLNPWDRTRVPGGSSGGSAAAVAAGSAPWALGTDTGGSIRQPAALCGGSIPSPVSSSGTGQSGRLQAGSARRLRRDTRKQAAAAGNSLPFTTAGSVRPGMVMFDEQGGYDTVERVERVEFDGFGLLAIPAAIFHTIA